MNILKKVFCFIYLINYQPYDKVGSHLFGLGGTGVVLISHIWVILGILRVFDIKPHISGNLIIWGMIFIYSVLAIYFFLFKNYKIVEEVKHYSPWKKPIIWGGIYFFLSLVSILIPLLIPLISGK